MAKANPFAKPTKPGKGGKGMPMKPGKGGKGKKAC